MMLLLLFNCATFLLPLFCFDYMSLFVSCCCTQNMPAVSFVSTTARADASMRTRFQCNVWQCTVCSRPAKCRSRLYQAKPLFLFEYLKRMLFSRRVADRRKRKWLSLRPYNTRATNDDDDATRWLDSFEATLPTKHFRAPSPPAAFLGNSRKILSWYCPYFAVRLFSIFFHFPVDRHLKYQVCRSVNWLFYFYNFWHFSASQPIIIIDPLFYCHKNHHKPLTIFLL